MNLKSMQCDDQSLLALLQSDEPHCDNPRDDKHRADKHRADKHRTAENAMLEHVEHCKYCQNRLESLAANAHEWQEAESALSAIKDSTETELLSQLLDATRSQFRYAPWTDGSAAWTESMAQRLLAPPSHPEMLGRLGRYEIEKMIGSGGMGIVFKAFDSDLNRPVAIKILAPFLSGNGSARKRFVREARAAAAVVHEHVVPIHNVETERDDPFLVMQYIAGESLQSRIDRSGPMQVSEILRIATQIASGLSAAHQQGLVHRDIKPSNILLEQGIDRALITDFGLARAVDDAALTSSGFHPGTPQYMSPEQAAGESVDARSDLFSLGSLLYTMCTGRPPFRAESSLSVMRRIVDDAPRPIREINPTIPTWLCGLISKLMAKRPADRFQDATQVADLLRQSLAHWQQPHTCPLPTLAQALQADPETPPLPAPTFRKRGDLMSKSILALLVITGFFSAIWWQQQQPSAELAALQGEWRLVESERDGLSRSPELLFNERLIIKGTRFSRPQTAPDGSEIKGESGRLSTAVDDSLSTLDFLMWEGTAHAIYRIEGDELVICLTREGGPRPDSFETAAGDSRVLNTYHRVAGSNAPSDTSPLTSDQPFENHAANQKWIESWRQQVSTEVPASANRDDVVQWLNDHGFQNIENKPITLEVMQLIHPASTQDSIEHDGIQNYVYGQLHADDLELHGTAVEVYFLFDDQDQRLSLSVGPMLMTNVHDQIQGHETNPPSDSSKNLAPLTDPANETSKLNGTWKAKMRSVDGKEQESEVGQILSFRAGRMDEVQLILNPNHQPGAIDVRYVEGPDQGKVLKGIYEWIPQEELNATADSLGPALKICLFTQPHPDQPNERPAGFEGGPGMDVAIWERLSFEPITSESTPLPLPTEREETLNSK